MWLSLEAGVARSLHQRFHIQVEVPPSPEHPYGRRSLVVTAAETYFPESGIEDLPAIAREELALGLTGRLRSQISVTDGDDPRLHELRDELIAALSGTPDARGALSVVDRVYTARLLRHQVPPIIAASCVGWYGHWRDCNAGPALDTADALSRCVDAWISQPTRRDELDAQITAHAQKLAGDPLIALEALST